MKTAIGWLSSCSAAAAIIAQRRRSFDEDPDVVAVVATFSRLFPMNRLTVNLLGTPTVHRNRRPVYIRRRKALALLVYLVTSQRMHGRDELAALFWPEQAQQAARGNLRRAIFSLHRLLGSVAPKSTATESVYRWGQTLRWMWTSSASA
jgi:hypothetical protein